VEKAAEKLSFLKTKSRQLRAYVLCGFGADYGKHRLSTQVEWPENTEILLADMPPSTASEVFPFFDNIMSLLGVIIISQPSDISALGMTRTIDFLRHKGIPIIGLVSMMDGYLCPSCGLVTHQLLSPKLAMEKVAKDCGAIETLLRKTGENGRAVKSPPFDEALL
jgi:Mrp family chromosome partitioning ATPase